MAVCCKAICHLFPLLRCVIEVAVGFFCLFPSSLHAFLFFLFLPVFPWWLLAGARGQTADRNIPWISQHLERAIGTLHWRLSNAWLAILVSFLRPKNLNPLQHLNVVVVRTAGCHSTIVRPISNMFIWVPYINILICSYCCCFLSPHTCEMEIGDIEAIIKAK